MIIPAHQRYDRTRLTVPLFFSKLMKNPDTDRLSRKLVSAEEYPAYELSDDNEYKAKEGLNDLIREHLAGVRNMRKGDGKKE